MSNNKTLDYSIKFLRRYHFTIAAICIAVLLAIEGLFLYRYFYTALTESKTLFELKQQAALTELKTPLFEKLVKFHAEKQKQHPVDWNALRDPFTPITPTTNSSP